MSKTFSFGIFTHKELFGKCFKGCDFVIKINSIRKPVQMNYTVLGCVRSEHRCVRNKKIQVKFL